MKRMNFPTRKQARQDKAKVREVDRLGRGDDRQLARLERNGHGHCAEAVRLRSELA